jgi:hypothetical protein
MSKVVQAWYAVAGRARAGALQSARMGFTSSPGTAQSQAPVTEHPWSEKAAFPLTIRAHKRYLEDSAGTPFLIHGDTAWSLIAQLTREDAEKYLEDRRTRGFNTILVNLIEHRFSTKPPANAYGQQPFLAAGDFDTPNEQYFAHADWVLRRAAEKGILVLLAPAYLGYRGGNDGWYKAMVAGGTAKLRSYGSYLGRRYRDFTNILWVHAGDHDPPQKELVRAIADGIREFDTNALHTAHCAPETAAIEYWKGEPWLQVNNVYTYKAVYSSALTQHARPEQMPFFLLESAYENEHRATELRIRVQAYQAVLSGAAGQIYGNNPIWHFDGPGLYPAETSWQEALHSRGAQSMTHLRTLLASLPWWTLAPNDEGVLLTGGAGSGQDRAVAASTEDKRMAVLYLPSIRKVRVALTQLQGPKVSARWYDPSNGHFTEIVGSPFPAEGLHLFQPGVLNSAGLEDWVLLLESTP